MSEYIPKKDLDPSCTGFLLMEIFASRYNIPGKMGG